MKISFLIPCRNEEKNIGILVPRLLKTYKNLVNEIIILNDGSRDGTKNAAMSLRKKYGRKVKLINRKAPHGVGHSLQEGIKKVNPKSDWILTMDADFLDNVGDIKKFINAVNKGYDGAIGSRFLNRHSLVNYPIQKKIANRAYHAAMRIVFGLRHRDVTNNFKFYKREIFDSIKLKAGNFAVNAETGILPIVKGYKIVEVPVVWKERDHGRSKFAVLKVGPGYLKVLLRILKEKYFG